MSVYAISCPNCGGSLDISGGRQIVTITCKYCGSVLDMEDEYKVLSTFNKVDLPLSPFRIGKSGKIDGIEFRIIGMVAYSCRFGVSKGEDTWIDYMLHSPTHGYAWLSYEDGTTTFSRRIRSVPKQNMFWLEPKANLEFDDRKYIFYEGYKAYVTFVQGELTYIAKKNDVVGIAEAISPPFGLTQERTKNESEYFVSRYLNPREVYESFGVKEIEHESFSPIKPFASPAMKLFSTLSLKFAVINLVIIAIMWLFLSGSFIGKTHFVGKDVEMLFHISDPSHLVKIEIDTDVRNDWAYYDMTVVDATTKQEVYSLAKEVSYYEGYDGEESWSEGSRDVAAYFNVKKSGDYILKIKRPEYHSRVGTKITIKESVYRVLYFVYLFGLFMVLSLFYIIKYFLHQSRLWKHVEDEDDD